MCIYVYIYIYIHIIYKSGIQSCVYIKPNMYKTYVPMYYIIL